MQQKRGVLGKVSLRVREGDFIVKSLFLRHVLHCILLVGKFSYLVVGVATTATTKNKVRMTTHNHDLEREH
jgi:hypothetical protein